MALSSESSLGTDTLPSVRTGSRGKHSVDHEVRRFELMMERFQLRRVPSNTSHCRGPTLQNPTIQSSRTLSRCSSIDTATTAAVQAIRRSSSRRGSATTSISAEAAAAVENEDHEMPSPSPPPPPLCTMDSTGSRKDSLETIRARNERNCPTTTTTFHATSLATRVRLCVVATVFAVKVVYVPYGNAYYPHHGHTLIIANAVFGLNMLATCNTSLLTARGHEITTRRAIWRHYRKHGFLTDLLAVLPFEAVLSFIKLSPMAHWAVGFIEIVFQLKSVYCHVTIFRAALARQGVRVDKSVLAWLFYSRYSHLVRIGGIVLAIGFLAHFCACMWSWLHLGVDPDFFGDAETITIHVRSIYEALQLLQGQGMETKTLPQAVFGSVAVLLGSIALAVVFGHVAILVANFSANNTAYQRKMERVFAVMGKLQLPHPVRERVHQYYEYLHTEYESLDGDVVKFAKDLSHTLELEVVLFKYMDVLMHVPHWRNCSPDFQKQLVLTLSVRVYLPDDFVMRRGEVGTECYIINRGTCKQCEYPTGNYEPPTPGMESEEHEPRAHRRRPSQRGPIGTSPYTPRTPRRTRQQLGSGPLGLGQSRFSIYEGALSEQEDSSDGMYSCVSELKRGQVIGEMALLANYERSSDLRAVAYVEMCVVERERFQRILSRHPRDRKLVISSMVRHTMIHNETNQIPCPFMKMVKRVAPDASILEGIQLVSQAMNPPESDATIVFGFTEQLFKEIQSPTDPTPTQSELVGPSVDGRRRRRPEASTTSVAVHGFRAFNEKTAARASLSKRERGSNTVRQDTTTATTTGTSTCNAKELLEMLVGIRDRLARIEHKQRIAHDCIHSNPHCGKMATDKAFYTSTKATTTTLVQHTHSTGTSSVSSPSSPLSPPPPVRKTRPVPIQTRASTSRILGEIAATLRTRRSMASEVKLSPTPWADRLFLKSKHVKGSTEIMHAVAKRRRSSLRRLNST